MADDQDKDSKTEQPTSKRLADAKNKGQMAQSQEVKTWMVLLASSVALVLLIPPLMSDVTQVIREFISRPHTMRVSVEEFELMLSSVSIKLGIILAPITALLFFAALIATVVQTGWTFSTDKLEIRWNAFSIIAGAKKIIGVRALVEFAKGIAKFVIVTVVALVLLAYPLRDMELFPGMELIITLDRLNEIAVRLAFGTVAVMTIVAFLDFLYQKWDHNKKMMMTKQEVKDESKQQDGDPKVKQRIAQIRMERQQRRMIAAMGKADVVITNPTHYAVALEYKMDSMPAPILIAKGVDSVAQRIREAADEHDVPIVENPPLARALYAAVELDQEIPPEHYNAVAEVIGYVYKLKGRMPQANAMPQGGSPEPQTEFGQG